MLEIGEVRYDVICPSKYTVQSIDMDGQHVTVRIEGTNGMLKFDNIYRLETSKVEKLGKSPEEAISKYSIDTFKYILEEANEFVDNLKYSLNNISELNGWNK